MAELIGLGLDLVEVERMRAVLDRTPTFADRTFTSQEIETARSGGDAAASFAARFAAKEATFKALGIGLWEVPLVSVEVVGGAGRAPSLQLHGPAADLADDRGVRRWMVSLSHDGGVAAAVVAALGD